MNVIKTKIDWLSIYIPELRGMKPGPRSFRWSLELRIEWSRTRQHPPQPVKIPKRKKKNRGIVCVRGYSLILIWPCNIYIHTMAWVRWHRIPLSTSSIACFLSGLHSDEFRLIGFVWFECLITPPSANNCEEQIQEGHFDYTELKISSLLKGIKNNKF